MGCDIHLFVEYRKKEESRDWSSFGGSFNPGRNYLLFGILSEGVRTEPKFRYRQRGLPENLGFASKHNAYYFIVDSEPDDDCCTLEDALLAQKHGNTIIYSNGKPTWIERSDWHSHSWLTLDEFSKALAFYGTIEQYNEVEYEAILQAMKTLEHFGNEVRIVFWFDN